jgi:cytidylate kinase
VVGEGRDLGTVVFPDAEVKIYLDADPATRARRRARELEERGLSVPFEQVLEEMERRDRRDRTRADSPLRAAEGAVVIESSRLDAAQVVEEVLRVVRAHPGCPGHLDGTTRAGGAPGATPTRPD